jgi:hypothetical protein
MVETLKTIDIDDFSETYRGYRSLFYPDNKLEPVPGSELIEYDKNNKYDLKLKPRNKVPNLALWDIGAICICWGKVLNETLSDYYVVEVFDGVPHSMILVHQNDLVSPYTEL